jgi:membrane carboxypeptidase/penicillin-binding protein
MSDDAFEPAPADEPFMAPKRSHAVGQRLAGLPLWAKITLGVIGGGVTVAMLGALALVIYLASLSGSLPAYDKLAEYEPPVTTRVYAADGSLVAEFARERRLFMPIETMPALVKDAFISAED